MRGRRLELDWQERQEDLYQLYRQERHPERRTRLQALWLLRRGKPITEVSEVVGVHYRTVQRWIAWYRAGGLDEVLRRVRGYHAQGSPCYLSSEQLESLVAQTETGEFHTIWDAVGWVREQWGIKYTYKGMHTLFRRHKLKKKVPRRQAEQASVEQQEEWKKGVSAKPSGQPG